MLESFLSRAWEIPASVLTFSYIAIGCHFCSFAPILLPYRPNHQSVKHYDHRIVLLSHTLGGNLLHLKFPRLCVATKCHN